MNYIFHLHRFIILSEKSNSYPCFWPWLFCVKWYLIQLPNPDWSAQTGQTGRTVSRGTSTKVPDKGSNRAKAMYKRTTSYGTCIFMFWMAFIIIINYPSPPVCGHNNLGSDVKVNGGKISVDMWSSGHGYITQPKNVMEYSYGSLFSLFGFEPTVSQTDVITFLFIASKLPSHKSQCCPCNHRRIPNQRLATATMQRSHRTFQTLTGIRDILLILVEPQWRHWSGKERIK